MTRIKLFTTTLMILLTPGLCCYAQDRQYIPLVQTWRFNKGAIEGAQKTDFNDSEWNEIKLPHTWNTDLINGKGYYKGAAWYRTTLPITPEMMGKRLFLRFEGALTIAEVFLNGQKIGRHKGGYSAFAYEITSTVNWNSSNVLAVRVDNSYNKDVVPVGDRLFTRFGGIYRPAWLLVTDKVYITPLDYASPGVYIRQEQVTDKRAELEITTKVSNVSKEPKELTVITTIFDADGQQVARTSNDMRISSRQTAPLVQKLSLDEPRLWNGRKNPYIYRVTVQLTNHGKTMDQVSQPLGLRYFHVDKDKGLFLNGRHLDLYGVSRHQEWEHEGSALTDEHHKEDIDLIMELGARGVRLAHYQQAETVYSLCDRNGLIVWAEIPVTPPYQKGNAKFLANAKQQLIELIRQNYNHPSILFWGLYNEVNIPEADVQKLYDLAKAEDPTRLVTAASSNNSLENRYKITDLICWNR
jgi:beta-galactosidase